MTFLQVPTLPVDLQYSHCPAQGLSQQTPSTQLAEVHSPPPAHAVPFDDWLKSSAVVPPDESP